LAATNDLSGLVAAGVMLVVGGLLVVGDLSLTIKNQAQTNVPGFDGR
jgi:hypothetical protein